MAKKKTKRKTEQDPETLQRFVESKTRQIVNAIHADMDEEIIDELEAERELVLKELGRYGAAYRQHAEASILRIEAEDNPRRPNPGLGLAEVLITGGLMAVGVLGIVMGVRTVRTAPPMPPI